MRMKLRLRPRADIDFAEHYLYISDRSPPAAERYFDAVYEARELIRKDPASGMSLFLPGFERQNLRYRRPKGFEKYLIIYQVVGSTVYIVRILHTSQDLVSALSDA